MYSHAKSSKETSQDTTALQARENTNQAYGQVDMLSWFVEKLQLEPSFRALDVGCGRGNQIERLAGLYPEAKFYGVDISADSIDHARVACAQRENTHFEAGDAGGPVFTGLSFDLIFSIYAFYYIPEPARALKSLRERLVAEGSAKIAVLSPYHGNNREWYSFLSPFLKLPDEIHWVSDAFTDQIVVPFGNQEFEQVTLHKFTNTITIPNLAKLRSYWLSNIYHKEEADEAFEAAAKLHFEENDSMQITKEAVLAILAGPRPGR